MTESAPNTDRRSLFLAWLLVGAVMVICAAFSGALSQINPRSLVDWWLVISAQFAFAFLLAAGCYVGLRRVLGPSVALTAVAPLVGAAPVPILAGILSFVIGMGVAPALLFAAAGLGALIGLIWGSWSGRQLRAALAGAALAMLAAAIGAWLTQSLCATGGCLVSRPILGALNGGLIGLAMALGVAPAILGLGPRELVLIHRTATRMRGEPNRRLRWLVLSASLLAGLNLIASFLIQGSQLCGWLDIALSRSGCYRTIAEWGGVERLALSPDGRLLAHSRHNYPGPDTIVVRIAGDGGVRYEVPFDDIPAQLSFSPDGGLLAAAGLGDGVVQVWAVADGALRYTLPEQSNRATFSLDGSELLTLTARYRAADGVLLGPLPEAETGLKGIAAGEGVYQARSRDGTLLAITGIDDMVDNEGRIEIRDETGALLITLGDASSNHIDLLWFSPDSAMLAARVHRDRIFSSDSALWIFRLSDGALIRKIDPHGQFGAVAWSADSRTLAAWEDRRGALFFRVAP